LILRLDESSYGGIDEPFRILQFQEDHSHSSANRSGEDERRWARFNIVIRRDRIILPSKDQRSADTVRRQLSNLGKKINSDLRPVFTSKKIADEIKEAEAKPPLINQQCVVYEFRCDLCDVDYVGYKRRHLF